jgi:hypothetical protein
MVVKINNVMLKEGVRNTSVKHIGFISGVRSGLPLEALCCVEKLADSKNISDRLA